MTTPVLVERSEILAGLDALRFVLQQSPVDPRFDIGYLTALSAVARVFKVSQEFETTTPPVVIELPRRISEVTR